MTDELRLPCRESDTPDDWFIREDGKQYPSDSLLSEAEEDAIKLRVRDETDPDGYLSSTDTWLECFDTALQVAIQRAEQDAKTAALARRRHAKEDCIFSCPIRHTCLSRALDTGETHGTWGGYYQEELEAIRTEIARRRNGTLLSVPDN